MKTKIMENYKLEELMREKYLPFSEKIFKKHFAPVKRKNVCDLKKINYIIIKNINRRMIKGVSCLKNKKGF